jgi:putative tryptophan/tyrosine transport system substrate-binding protein
VVQNEIMHPIGRRTLLAGVGALLTTPLVCRSQSADKPRRIGFLSLETADSEGGQLAQKLIPEALKQRGYVEGGNLVIEWRWSNGKIADLPELAAELVRSKVEIIIARTNAPIRAAMKATQTIPIVMLNGNFPVEEGLVKSLARPGGNVTGTSYWVSTENFGKHFQILKELAPRTDRVAALRNANFAATALNQAIQSVHKRAAAQLGMTVHYFDVRQPEDIGAALSAIAASGIKAMFYQGDAMMRTRTAEIMAFLRDHRFASIAVIPTFAEAGGLAHYSPDGRAFYDRTADYVGRILKGARPSELPVEEPTSFELVINLKTAKAIGLTIPPSMLQRADRLIE